MTPSRKVQRQIAFTIAIIGGLVSVINFFNNLWENTFIGSFLEPDVSIVFIMAFVFLLSGFSYHVIFRFVQVFILSTAAFIAILDVYNSIHGLGLVIIAVFLSFKYGFFEKFVKTKIAIIIIALFTTIELSAHQNSKSVLMVSLDSLLFLSMFLIISYIIYQDEIGKFIRERESDKDLITNIQNQKSILQHKIQELDAQLDSLINPIDLKAMGITPAEERTIEALILYRETEAKLAKRLGISFHTVKTHFRNVRDKLGVDRRDEIIDMCRNNYRLD